MRRRRRGQVGPEKAQVITKNSNVRQASNPDSIDSMLIRLSIFNIRLSHSDCGNESRGPPQRISAREPPYHHYEMTPTTSARHRAVRALPLESKLRKSSSSFRTFIATMIIVSSVITALLNTLSVGASGRPESGLRFNQDTGAYSGLTYSFDPRLDKQEVEKLHFDHWHSIMHQASSLLYESLNGRAHLGEVRVLIPYKWRHSEWPVLHKPGSPIIANRRLRYSDSDIIVGQDDPVHKESPFSLQHDECGRPGLTIHMPLSFLEGAGGVDERLRARQFVREFASHRWGLFKESGFRSDYMYPPFSALAGIATASLKLRWANSTGGELPLGNQNQSTVLVEQLNEHESSADASSQTMIQLRGFDDQWCECKFETSSASGLPLVNAQNCLPYLATGQHHQAEREDFQHQSFNLMSADPFSYATTPSNLDTNTPQLLTQLPANLAHWRQLAESARWHFCGQNFPAPSTSQNQLVNAQQQMEQPKQANWFDHNQRTANKQNKLCHERSAFDVIKSSDDFRHIPFGLPTFNRMPEPQFKFLQEMPPRVVLAFEYTSHLYSSRRLDHSVLESAINKFLAFDLIPDSEVATIVFGQHASRLMEPFQRLDVNLKSRFSLFNPAFDPFDEQVQVFTQQELLDELGGNVNTANLNQQLKIVKGSCSFARLMNEVNVLLQKISGQYDDVGADLIVITSGLFVEDAEKIEEIIKQSQLRLDQHKLNLIIYPATMLFDTKSRENYSVLNSMESDLIVKARVEKLLLIQRLMNGQIHFVKENLDSNGEAKMSTTLMQFYQIFEHISRGHSWDQTNSMYMLEHKLVDSKPNNNLISNGSTLMYQFEFDSTITNELFIGFVDPRPSSLSGSNINHRPGKRFALKNVQLQSPNRQLTFSEAHTTSSVSLTLQRPVNDTGIYSESKQSPNDLQSDIISSESAFFAYRAQLSFAGFHLFPWHLGASSTQVGRPHASGIWTLTAVSEEQLQTSAVLMAKTNPTGDTLTARCWIQTYLGEKVVSDPGNRPKQPVKSVKVFVKLDSSKTLETNSIGARMEVHDEMGNIVQNTRLLDDGLGEPDITRNDNIYTQYVQRAHKPGFYKVTVEVGKKAGEQHNGKVPSIHTHSGQDNVCCGSFVPKSADHPQQPILGHLRRQIYCGTFYVDSSFEQRPPAVNNLTVINVDQDQRRVTLRWVEPQASDSLGSSLDISSSYVSEKNTRSKIYQDSKTSSMENMASRDKRSLTGENSFKARSYDIETDLHQSRTNNEPRAVITDQSKNDQFVPPLSSRYEIKLFTDRDMMKKAFDAKHEVGFKFNEWNVEGILPNASIFGGMKEVTLRIPFGKEGIYFIAMKVYNNLGIASELSNIVQFYLRNNLTLEELESIYGQSTTVDAEGNHYDKNGDLISRGAINSYSSLLKSAQGLDGLSILILLAILAFFMSIICVTLVAYLTSSAKRSLCRKHKDPHDSKKRSNGSGSNGSMLAGSGSSVVSAGSSPAASSNSSSCGSTDGEALQQKQMLDQQNHQQQQYGNYNNRCLQQAHEQQQQQAQMIHNQMLDREGHYNQQQLWPQHTIVNGYSYATVGPATAVKNSDLIGAEHFGNPYGTTSQSNGNHVHPLGDLNQNGLGVEDEIHQPPMSPVQSWSADVLLNHYDKVKQARELNQPPTAMRVEALDGGEFNDGLPVTNASVEMDPSNKLELGFLMRQQQQMSSYMINQQLQQQLSSVLKSKRQRLSATGVNVSGSSSPALEGVRGDNELESQQHQYQASNIEPQMIAPPPPQYIYGSDADEANLAAVMANGLATHRTDPSIYSQATNLHQVITSQSYDDGAGYYANQWPTQGADPSLYGTAARQQYDEGITQNSFDARASSAAISEV